MVDEARRKNHAVVEERHNDRSCPHARKTGLFVVRLTNRADLDIPICGRRPQHSARAGCIQAAWKCLSGKGLPGAWLWLTPAIG